jgi:N-methylhydantoinase B
VGLNYVLYSLNPDLLLNAGMLRIARCILPKGSVLNPEPPAAVGMRSLTCMVLQVVVLGAFSRAVPQRLPACPASGMSILNVKTMGSDGRAVMASIGPIGGGAGGAPNADGSDGSGANSAFLRNTPVEINEAEVPIRIHRYSLVPHSAGAGKYRGGLGLVMEFQVFSPNTLVTARNRDRSHFGAWGVLGGLAGRTSTFTRNPGTSGEENLGNTDLVACRPGDVIRCEGGGGGGYGDPFERAPAKVLEDVRRGYVAVGDARMQYGVVIRDGVIDEIETERLREKRGRRTPAAHFNYGPLRVAHETKWTEPRYAVLTRRLAELPVNWRFFLKHQAFDELDGRIEVGNASEGPGVIDDIFDALVRRYPELMVVRASRAA